MEASHWWPRIHRRPRYRCRLLLCSLRLSQRSLTWIVTSRSAHRTPPRPWCRVSSCNRNHIFRKMQTNANFLPFLRKLIRRWTFQVPGWLLLTHRQKRFQPLRLKVLFIVVIVVIIVEAILMVSSAWRGHWNTFLKWDVEEEMSFDSFVNDKPMELAFVLFLDREFHKWIHVFFVWFLTGSGLCVSVKIWMLTR